MQTIVTVPEAPMYEQGDMSRREYQIGLARKVAAMQSEVEAELMCR